MQNKGGGREKRITKKIVDAAAKDFAEYGFAGARVDRIAELAGVNKATIYYHIGDKSALYREALLSVLGRINEDLNEQIGLADGVEEKLRKYVEVMVRNISSSRYFSPIMTREIASGGSQLPNDVKKRMAEIGSTLKEILDEGAGEKKFIKADPIILHLMIVGSINFYVAGAGIRASVAQAINCGAKKVRKTDYSLVEKQIAEIILHGLIVKKKGRS